MLRKTDGYSSSRLAVATICLGEVSRHATETLEDQMALARAPSLGSSAEKGEWKAELRAIT